MQNDIKAWQVLLILYGLCAIAWFVIHAGPAIMEAGFWSQKERRESARQAFAAPVWIFVLLYKLLKLAFGKETG